MLPPLVAIVPTLSMEPLPEAVSVTGAPCVVMPLGAPPAPFRKLMPPLVSEVRLKPLALARFSTLLASASTVIWPVADSTIFPDWVCSADW